MVNKLSAMGMGYLGSVSTNYGRSTPGDDAWDRKIAQKTSALTPELQYHFSIWISIDQLFLVSYSLSS